MNKQEFLAALRKGIESMPLPDINRSLDYYSEMIDDCIENGMSESDAVASMGEVDEIISQILGAPAAQSAAKENTKTKKKEPIKAWVIVLAAVGTPVWLPLLAAALIILFAVYIVVYAVAASLWIVNASLAVAGVACLPLGVTACATGGAAVAPFAWGVGFLLMGLSILLFFGSLQTTLAIVKATKATVMGIVRLFSGKGDKNEKVN